MRESQWSRPQRARARAQAAPPVQSLHPARLEDDSALIGRIDREARVLESQEHPSHSLDGRRVAVDENERRARRERLPQPHPRFHAGRLRSAGHRAEERLLPPPVRAPRERVRAAGARAVPLSARTRE